MSKSSSPIVSKVVEHEGGHIGLTANGRVVPAATCALCGNGYVSIEACDAHPCEAPGWDADTLLSDWAGVFEDGHDDGQVNDLNDALTTVEVACLWGTHDLFGFGGDAEIIVREIRMDGSRGPWSNMGQAFWDVLFGGEVQPTSGDLTDLVGTRHLVTEETLAGWPVHVGVNYAVRDLDALD